MFGLYTFLGRRVLALQAKLNTTANSSATDDMPYETLDTPQRHQSRTREAFRQRNINVDESPRRRRTPATRPETPTPPPGAAESARMQARQSARDIWDNDLEDSPRRRRPGESQDENQPLSVSSSGGSVMRHGLGTRVALAPISNDLLLRSPPLTPISVGANHQIISPRQQVQLPPSRRSVALRHRHQQARLQREQASQATKQTPVRGSDIPPGRLATQGQPAAETPSGSQGFYRIIVDTRCTGMNVKV